MAPWAMNICLDSCNGGELQKCYLYKFFKIKVPKWSSVEKKSKCVQKYNFYVLFYNTVPDQNRDKYGAREKFEMY